MIQSELYARPDDVYVNIRLVELYRSHQRLKDAVAHCRAVERDTALRSSLEWNACVVQTLKVGGTVGSLQFYIGNGHTFLYI